MAKQKSTKLYSKKWTFEVEYMSDGTNHLTRTNEGFTVPELLGLLEYTKQDVLLQMIGDIKPTTVKRKFIK